MTSSRLHRPLRTWAIATTLLVPLVTAQITQYQPFWLACRTDCTPLYSAIYACNQDGREDVNCICGSSYVAEFYVGSTCSCTSDSDSQAFATWWTQLCPSYVASSSAYSASVVGGRQTQSQLETQTSASDVTQTTSSSNIVSPTDPSSYSTPITTDTSSSDSPTPTTSDSSQTDATSSNTSASSSATDSSNSASSTSQSSTSDTSTPSSSSCSTTSTTTSTSTSNTSTSNKSSTSSNASTTSTTKTSSSASSSPTTLITSTSNSNSNSASRTSNPTSTAGSNENNTPTSTPFPVAASSFLKRNKWFLPVIIILPLLLIAGILLFLCFNPRNRQRNSRGYTPTPNSYNRLQSSSKNPWLAGAAFFSGKRNRNNNFDQRTSSAASQNTLVDADTAGMSMLGGGLYNRDYSYQGGGGAGGGHGNINQPLITPGSYPHGRPLSPVEEVGSMPPTPAMSMENVNHTALGGGIGGQNYPVPPRRPVPASARNVGGSFNGDGRGGEQLPMETLYANGGLGSGNIGRFEPTRYSQQGQPGSGSGGFRQVGGGRYDYS